MSEAADWIRLYNFSREFHVLPFPGALLDQPDEVIKKFEIIMMIQNEDIEREDARTKAKTELEEQSGNRRS